MRALGEPDAFPSGDLGLRQALANGKGPVTPAEVEARAEAWRPWRAYAAIALWTHASATSPPRNGARFAV
jgi:3-methyladenine DNA glycosylase/8-oxoguanine DNA glycosylase